jgi:hypothetical protein
MLFDLTPKQKAIATIAAAIAFCFILDTCFLNEIVD